MTTYLHVKRKCDYNEGAGDLLYNEFDVSSIDGAGLRPAWKYRGGYLLGIK